MNKSELIKTLSERQNIQLEEAALIVNSFFDAIKEALVRGERVEIRGFGSFKIKSYGEYKGRNPKTGESVKVKSKRLPFFRPGKDLKDYVNQ